MKKNKIKSVMVTKIYLRRRHLITKEKMESYCKGEEWLKDSVNDDQEELELVERRDTSYCQTFFQSWNPDVDETEMMLSESDSKYIYAWSWRRTFVIENSSNNSLKKNCSLQ